MKNREALMLRDFFNHFQDALRAIGGRGAKEAVSRWGEKPMTASGGNLIGFEVI